MQLIFCQPFLPFKLDTSLLSKKSFDCHIQCFIVPRGLLLQLVYLLDHILELFVLFLPG
jgi:hypothetical protein